ncbi:hypothetical protein HK102_012623, partial [Quaeritorhiza haematococci]
SWWRSLPNTYRRAIHTASPRIRTNLCQRRSRSPPTILPHFRPRIPKYLGNSRARAATRKTTATIRRSLDYHGLFLTIIVTDTVSSRSLERTWTPSRILVAVYGCFERRRYTSGKAGSVLEGCGGCAGCGSEKQFWECGSWWWDFWREWWGCGKGCGSRKTR